MWQSLAWLAGHAFNSVGLAPCNLDTAAAALGTTILVPFSVYDNGSPQLMASVNRTLLVVSPCAAGVCLIQFLCIQESWTCADLSQVCIHSSDVRLRLLKAGCHS